jgi:hypothetical protein
MEKAEKEYSKGKVDDILKKVTLKGLEGISSEDAVILESGINNGYISREEVLEKEINKILISVYRKKGRISKEDNEMLNWGVKMGYVTQEEREEITNHHYSDILKDEMGIFDSIYP